MRTPPRILIPVADDYEDMEAWYPRYRMEAAGARVIFASVDGRPCRGKHGYPLRADAPLQGIRADDVQGVMVPGGWAPDALRRVPQLLELCQRLDERGGMLATICHGPWVFISARLVRGRKMTSTPGIKDDLENAGALWRDDACVVDGNMISARRPPDLPAFGEEIARFLAAH